MTEQTKPMTEQELFDQLVDAITIQLGANSTVANLKTDAKYSKKNNPGGIPAARVSVIAKAAKLEAEAQFEEYALANAEVQQAYKEFTGYDA